MSTKIFFILIFILSFSVHAEITVKTIDFLSQVDVQVNAAGPLLVKADAKRNRIILANTLTSSISIISGQTHSVLNIPLESRTLQHLKSSAMTFREQNCNIYLIGTNNFHIITPKTKSSKSINTNVQFESIAVDEETGNVFIEKPAAF